MTLFPVTGMQGKLNKLTSTFVAMNPASVQSGLQEAYQALDRLLLGCLAHKKDLMERQIDDSQQHDQ